MLIGFIICVITSSRFYLRIAFSLVIGFISTVSVPTVHVRSTLLRRRRCEMRHPLHETCRLYSWFFVVFLLLCWFASALKTTTLRVPHLNCHQPAQITGVVFPVIRVRRVNERGANIAVAIHSALHRAHNMSRKTQMLTQQPRSCARIILHIKS